VPESNDPAQTVYDDLIVGTGMSALTLGALLAQSGRRVLMLEAHEYPGGYAHTFPMGDYRFCAQVHYIFGCGEGGTVRRFLDRVGLTSEVEFEQLEPDGYDHVIVAGERYRIPNGFPKFRDRLIARHPEARRPLERYFDVVIDIADQLARLPDHVGWRDLVTAPLRFGRLIRHRNWTLQRLYDHVGMPQRLQAVLAGQSGDYLLPPEQVSLPLHVALTDNYGRGAYYPKKHFSHLVESVANIVRDAPGCGVLLEHEVASFMVDGDRVVGVRTSDGSEFRARRFVSNIDPTVTLGMLEGADFAPKYRQTLDYEYSCSNFTMYLGIKDLDLREHGFGSYNVWRYAHDDLNRMYRDQLERHDLSDPWLFLATPTLHSDAPGIAPPGHQILEVATACDYGHFATLARDDPRAYTKEKIKVRDRIFEILEDELIPGLRGHLAMRVAGTPTTNEHFCRAPRGNAYGAALTPEHTQWPRVAFETPLRNLFLVNATAGYPSIGGTVGSGMRLFDRLHAEDS
jgi:phytoene dehydrogenase-like protein